MEPKTQFFCQVDVQEFHLWFFAVVVFGIAFPLPLGNIENASACHTGRRMTKSEKTAVIPFAPAAKSCSDGTDINSPDS
jgi:hypothetical protein